VNLQGVRTNYFDAYFQAAAADGVRQIVLLAAGLDSRGYRLGWPEKTVIFELDQPQVLGFDPAKPSAWIAEGLLIYLPASAQHQLFSGIDALAAPGSHVAVEEAVPLDTDTFEAKRDEERAAGNEDTFFSLVYNEQHTPAHEWFGVRGWRAVPTPLTDQLRALGRPVPEPGSEAGLMIGNISLVSATKRLIRT
jgi:O-methyltransferase involved in polyketide biosynthesis